MAAQGLQIFPVPKILVKFLQDHPNQVYYIQQNITINKTNDGSEKSDIPQIDSKPQSFVDSSVDAADWTKPTSLTAASWLSMTSDVPSTSPEQIHAIRTGLTAMQGPADVTDSRNKWTNYTITKTSHWFCLSKNCQIFHKVVWRHVSVCWKY